MLYEHTLDNIKEYIYAMEMVPKEQLLTFFSDCNPYTVEHSIQSLLSRNLVKLELREVTAADGFTDEVEILKATRSKVKKKRLEEVMQAGWVMASFGSENIDFFLNRVYPVQLSFLTKDHLMYDVAVMNTLQEASIVCQLIRTIRDQKLIRPAKAEDAKGIALDFPEDFDEAEFNDCGIHLALVSSESIGKVVKETGLFDSIVILDKDHIPHYYSCY